MCVQLCVHALVCVCASTNVPVCLHVSVRNMAASESAVACACMCACTFCVFDGILLKCHLDRHFSESGPRQPERL